MNTRGRLILGGLSVVVGVVAFALTFTLPDTFEPFLSRSQARYTNGYAISHLPMAALALILVGVLIGVFPAGRSPYRLILSGIAVAAAPLGVVDTLSGFDHPEVSPPAMNLTAPVAALAVGLLLVVGAAVIAGLGPVVAVASAVAVFGARAALSASDQNWWMMNLNPSLLTMLPIAGLVLVAWAVLLTGDRRGWPRTVVLAILGAGAMYLVSAATAIYVPARWALTPPVPALQHAFYPNDRVPSPAPLDYLVVGVMLGAIAAALVVLGRPRSGAAGIQSGQGVESARLRRLTGGAVVAAAIGFWSYGLAIVEPSLRAGLDAALAALRADPDPESCCYNSPEPNALVGRDVRWAAVILGIGGILLLVRGSNRRTVAAMIALVGWPTVDVVGGRLHLSGWLAGAGAAVVVALVVTAAVLVGNRVSPGPARPLPLRLVYAEVALAAAPMLTYLTGGYRLLSSATEQACGVLAVLLVLTGVAVAVTAGPRQTAGRVLFAVVVAGSGTAAMVWRYFIEDPSDRIGARNAFDLPLAWYLAVTAIAVVALGVGRPRTWHAWVVGMAAALVAPSLAFAAASGALVTERLAEPELSRLTGAWGSYDAYSILVIEVLAGITVALMIVVAGSWWGRPAAVPAATPPQPVEVPPVVLSTTAAG